MCIESLVVVLIHRSKFTLAVTRLFRVLTVLPWRGQIQTPARKPSQFGRYRRSLNWIITDKSASVWSFGLDAHLAVKRSNHRCGSCTGHSTSTGCLTHVDCFGLLLTSRNWIRGDGRRFNEAHFSSGVRRALDVSVAVGLQPESSILYAQGEIDSVGANQ